MHQENNQRRSQDETLIAEENKFPALQQTATRRQAETRMMSRIQAARSNNVWSIMQKQLEKQSAELEYQQLLQTQAQSRAAAAKVAA